jgi:hypothetical protein
MLEPAAISRPSLTADGVELAARLCPDADEAITGAYSRTRSDG